MGSHKQHVDKEKWLFVHVSYIHRQILSEGFLSARQTDKKAETADF